MSRCNTYAKWIKYFSLGSNDKWFIEGGSVRSAAAWSSKVVSTKEIDIVVVKLKISTFVICWGSGSLEIKWVIFTITDGFGRFGLSHLGYIGGQWVIFQLVLGYEALHRGVHTDSIWGQRSGFRSIITVSWIS